MDRESGPHLVGPRASAQARPLEQLQYRLRNLDGLGLHRLPSTLPCIQPSTLYRGVRSTDRIHAGLTALHIPYKRQDLRLAWRITYTLYSVWYQIMDGQSMRSRPVCTRRGWQSSTSAPSRTRAATHSSRRSAATVLAFSTATPKLACSSTDRRRGLRSRVSVCVRYTSTRRPRARSRRTNSTSACSFGLRRSAGSAGAWART